MGLAKGAGAQEARPTIASVGEAGSFSLAAKMRQRNYLLPHVDTSTQYQTVNTDDADVGAGYPLPPNPVSETFSEIETAPSSACTINSSRTGGGDLEFFEDKITEPVLVLGIDISDLPRHLQFAACACGLFFFSLLYGYLQELLSVQMCSRKLGLFLAMTQFSGYTVLAYVLRSFVYKKQQRSGDLKKTALPKPVPLSLYLGLSILRAVDLAMTNLAMQYINYPAKTLMKSSRVVFTMIFGVLIQRKVYKLADYGIVMAMVFGLALFMHADSTSSAVFEPLGVVMLTISLVCDGAISNMSETIMSQFGVGQDEFIFRLYSISLIAIVAAAAVKGDLWAGLLWIMQPGTYQEYLDNVPVDERTWSSTSKIAVMVVFSSMGFFGSSCSAALTKYFGALTMSITSTARKATTLFLSFLLFNNVCTLEHLGGMAIFISALTTKSLRRAKTSSSMRKKKKQERVSPRVRDKPTIPSVESTPERLTFRHTTSSPPSNTLVHVV